MRIRGDALSYEPREYVKLCTTTRRIQLHFSLLKEKDPVVKSQESNFYKMLEY